MILWDNIPANDCAGRYIPMAEAFSAGNWRYAFHPRIPPLFPMVSGLVAKILLVDGFTATKCVSALFFALTVFPLFGLARTVWGRHNAIVTVILYLLCSRLLRLAGMGLRDTAKCFFFTLATYGMIRFLSRRNWSDILLLVIGAAGLALLRGDSLIFALLFLIWALAEEVAACIKKRKIILPVKSLAGVVMFFIIITPWLYYEYIHTGYPVTESRIAMVIAQLKKEIVQPPVKTVHAEAGLVARGREKNPPVKTVARGSVPIALDAESEEDAHGISDFFEELFKGFFPPYLIFILPVLFFRIKERKLSRYEWLLLVVVLGHAALMVAQIFISDSILYVSKRYLITVAPLTFGWAALGVRSVRDGLRRVMTKRWRWCVDIGLAACSVIMVADGWLRIRPTQSVRKGAYQAGLMQCASWLKSNGKSYVKVIKPMPFDIYEYRTNNLPVVLAESPKISGLAGSGFIDLNQYSGNLTDFCMKQNVHLIVFGPEWKRDLSLLDNCPQLLKIKDFREGGLPFVIFGFKPNIITDRQEHKK